MFDWFRRIRDRISSEYKAGYKESYSKKMHLPDNLSDAEFKRMHDMTVDDYLDLDPEQRKAKVAKKGQQPGKPITRSVQNHAKPSKNDKKSRFIFDEDS